MSNCINIEPGAVIKLIEQYLKENNLLRTLQTLQDESSVSLNTVDSIETFVSDINSGHWDVVLRVVKLLKLPDNKLIDLYEQIAIELIELRETRAANWLIHKAEPMLRLKSMSPDRYLHLQNILGRSYFDHKEVYRDGSSKEQRRAAIAKELKKEVTVVPPQRLLTLISDAMKWQKHEGLLPSSSSIDIFTGKAQMTQVEEETYPTTMHRHCIKPIKNVDDDDEMPIFVTCADFSPDGHHLVVGYSTGLVEVRNPTTGRISKDLRYQSQMKFIVTPSKKAALAFCFSAGEMLAIGDGAGDISVWKLETGELIQLFESAHLKSVKCLLFHRNGKEILSGGNDRVARLHGMRSNKTIRDYKGHKSNVNAISFSRDDNYIITGSSDATVKIWNARTTQMLREYTSPRQVHTIFLMPNYKSDIFLIGDRSRCIYLIDLEAKIRGKMYENPAMKVKNEQEAGNDKALMRVAEDLKPMDDISDFYAVCSSPKGNWIYAVDSRNINCFNYATKKIQKKLVAHDLIINDLTGVKHHPMLNVLVTYDTQGNLKLWKP